MAIGVITSVGQDPEGALRRIREMGIRTVQLASPPEELLRPEAAERLKEAARRLGVEVTTVFCGFSGESYRDIPTIRRTVGLLNPEFREERVQRTLRISDFAKTLGVDEIAAHVGFIPEEKSDPAYSELAEAVRRIADHCARNGQSFCLETGQESAETLLGFIKDVARPNIRVNFDPANMVLYGSGDPIQALELLGEYVAGVHCKDGRWPAKPGLLGQETPLGEGDVNIEAFVEKLKQIGYTGPLTIERETSGEEQTRDILRAKMLLERLKG
ncbi:MAG: sugar phosphate isomerase/epimerase family protein [Candidatus Bathyarchaeia archaeon]